MQGHSAEERKTVPGKRDVGIIEVLPVGNYAVRLVFDDLHSTGIFGWEYLLDLGRNYAAYWQDYLEGSPENFYPGVNTTGTSFDANSQIYSRIVDFERGTTKVIPGLAEKWDISADGKVYTFHLRNGVKWQSNANFKPTRDFNADDIIFASIGNGSRTIPISR